MKARFPLLAVVVFVGLTSVNWTPQSSGIGQGDPAALNKHGTTMTPVLDEPVLGAKNMLWCATFQIAWDEAGERLGRPILLEPACNLADSLNRNQFDRKCVDEASVFTAGGTVEDGILTKIDTGIRAKTGKTSILSEQMKQGAKPGDLVFFAMLHKNLAFTNPFGKLGSMTLGGHQVSWFGFTPEQKQADRLRQQVRVHHYSANNDFVIELLCKETGDQLLLAKLPAPPGTLGGLNQIVLQRLRADAPTAQFNDLLAVPNVVAVETTEFTQLEGLKVAGKDWVLRQALQSIEFRMDENGVKLDSKSKVSFGCAKELEPRRLILDPPFALIMKRDVASQPYFVAWFANADLLGVK